MFDKEILSLINLLEDPDQMVYELVSEKIKERGMRAIPILEKAWETSIDIDIQQKIENLIQNIQFLNIKRELISWLKTKNNQMIYGAYLIAKYQYPDLFYSEIEGQIEILRKEIWLELNRDLTALEKVRIINHVLFAMHHFGKNTANYYSPRNSFINQVLETKKGNPITLSVIYTALAQKLNLPIVGVNLPLNYVLAYTDPYYTDDPDGILFYINPYKNGSVLSRRDIKYFLEKQKLELKAEYFRPCSNIVTMERILRNLAFSYKKLGYIDKLNEVTELIMAVETHKESQTL